MIAGTSMKFCVTVAAALFIQGSATNATPVEKVVQLLKDLSSKVAAEGAQEAAEYDKFACFCKEQADQKTYAIEKSDALIKDLNAEITVLENDLAKISDELDKTHMDIDDYEESIGDKTYERRKQHEAYLEDAKDMNEAIDACERAIEALKNSKNEMRGAKVDLVQVTSGLTKVIKRKALLAQTSSAAKFLAKVDQPGAPKFEYQSNDIIATLEDLRATFKEMKKKLDLDEFSLKESAETEILGLEKQKQFARKAAEENDAIGQAKSEKKASKMDQKKDEQDDMEADGEFRSRLGQECEKRAEMFDQRSRVRSQELTALSEALTDLQKNAVRTYKKGVSGLQTSAIGRLGKRIVNTATGKSPPALVQIAEVQHHASRNEGALGKVSSFLFESAKQLGSGVLNSAAVRVGLVLDRSQAADDGDDANEPSAPTRKKPVDHFVQVRRLIKDLINKLEKDAKNEATRKENCDNGIEDAVTGRDKAQAKIEVATAELTVLTGNKEKLQDHNNRLDKEIAQLKKSNLEVQELTQENLKNLDEQIAQCKEGVGSVDYALSVLNKFYGTTAHESKEEYDARIEQGKRDDYNEKFVDLLQAKKYTPKGADRDGNIVKDMAPETVDEEYKGAQDESAGIIGILEVIAADFVRSLKKAESDREEAEMMGKSLLEEGNKEIEQFKAQIEKNDGSLTETEEELLEQQNALKDAKDDLDNEESALAEWHSQCVQGEETWDQRKSTREAEIRALQEAIRILSEWQV